MKFILSAVLAMCASQATLAADVKAAADVEAAESKPSEASIRQLFETMHTASLIDNLMSQVEGTVRGSMAQAVAGQKPNAQQQKILEDMEHRIFALVKEQLDWKELEPMMVDVYRNTFSQREVDGMLNFYRSDVGQAVVTKLPTATQQSMAAMQGRMRSLTPKIQQLERDAAAQIKAAGEVQKQPAPRAGVPPPGAQPTQPPQQTH